MSGVAWPGAAGRRVLLVGHADDRARIVTALLEAAGVTVVGPVDPATPVAGDCDAATPDAVLLDAASCRRAAVGTAVALAALRRALPSATLAVLADGHGDPEDLIAAGADEVLAGPLTLHALIEGLHLADTATRDPAAGRTATGTGGGAGLGWLPPMADGAGD